MPEMVGFDSRGQRIKRSGSDNTFLTDSEKDILEDYHRMKIVEELSKFRSQSEQLCPESSGGVVSK